MHLKHSDIIAANYYSFSSSSINFFSSSISGKIFCIDVGISASVLYVDTPTGEQLLHECSLAPPECSSFYAESPCGARN